jgi:hypothetical protein
MSILSSLLGLGQGQPTQVIPTAVTEPKIAEELAPFLKDILGKGQALYKQRMEEGFVPFEGQTLADVTAQQRAAQEGIAGLVGTQKPVLDEAGVLVRGGAERATAEALQPFMNPYQQAVTDIAKRQAQERFEQETLPGLRKQAIDAGAFGGSRAAMRESQAQDAQARLLADIQAKGDLAAFQDARRAFETQKAREAQTAEGLSGLAQTGFAQQLKEFGQLEAVGREEQQRQQQLLDESYKRFLQERQFPEQQLGQYQSLVAGIPVGQQSITRTPQQFQPSPIAQALGTATGIANIYGAFSGRPPIPTPFQTASGGQVVPAKEGTEGGLSVIIKMIRAQKGKGGDPRSKRSEEIRTRMQQEDVTDMLDAFEEGGLPMIQRQQNGTVFPNLSKQRLIVGTGEADIFDDEDLSSVERRRRLRKKGINFPQEGAKDPRAKRSAKITEEKKIEELEKDIDALSDVTTGAGDVTIGAGDVTTDTGTGTDTTSSNYMQELIASLLAGQPTVDKTAAFEAIQKAIAVDDEANKQLYDAMMADKRFQRRQATLAGLTKGLLAPKTGRGGIFADIQGGLLGATDELMKTGDNKDILNFMKDMSKDKRQAAILSAQTSLEALKDKEGISQKDYANKLAVLSQLAEFEKLGVELDSEEYKQFEAFNETLLTATSEKAKALRDSGKISKMIKNPALRRLLENQIKDKIGKAEGKEGTTAKDTVKITEE